MKLRSAVIVLALGAVAAAAAGIARSTSTQPIPDASGVIHACHKKPIGEVKIVYSAASCGPGQTPIQWSRTGPPGPQGDPGAQGPAGPPGDEGHVHETFVSDPVSSIALPVGTSTGTFVTLGAPGTYWVFAKGMLSELGGSPDGSAFVGCELELDFVELDSTGTMLLESGHPANEDSITLAGVAEAAQPGQRLKLVCANQGGLLRVALFGPRLYALKVA